MILTNSYIPGYMGGTSNQTLLRPTLLGNGEACEQPSHQAIVLGYFLPMMTSMVFAEAGARAHDVS